MKGIVYFLKNKISVFGPNKYASKLEGSKVFMKRVCRLKKIPTAKFKVCNKKRRFKFSKKKSITISCQSRWFSC